MSEKKSGFEIAESQRQSWKSIALVWIDAMICVACLMVSGMLGEGMSIGTCIITILIGYGIVCLYMSFIGMQGCDTGLHTAVIAGGALGETSGKYVISAILVIACIGWFRTQAAVCGASFSTMIGSMTGAELPVWLCSVVWGIIMVSTACFGFSIITGPYDICVMLTAAGVPAIGLVALFLATWTTNVTNAYSG